ncbi:alpha/beta hydrolase [Streptomyces atroolivaceus]|uniref:Alpha/beta hydrolase n=1 Tax=Streptomyces atroolivaceus TaxID=66869 RepID=A0ABV9VHD8_STRAZ|nr:alpha/beta hydrolase [Streptomyces atroolivaceus]
MAARFRLPRGTQSAEERIAGVPVVRFSSGGCDRGTVLAFHGGAYMLGTAHVLSIPVAKDGGPDVVSVGYRLSPEHPYPAAQDDAMAVYRALLETVGAARVAVMGDSAGGGLALTLLQAAAAEGLAMPRALVAVHPWADLSLSGASSTANAGRDVLVRSELEQAADWYARERDLQDPSVSPLFGSFERFPRTYIAVGTRDLLLDDSRRVASRMRDQGVDVRLDVFPGAPHGFNAVPLAQGRQCNARARGFIEAGLLPR